jgi:hypothetical protein
VLEVDLFLPNADLLHTSCTPLTCLLHASYTPLTQVLKVDLFPPNSDLFAPIADAPKAAFQSQKKKKLLENLVPANGKLSLSIKVLTLLLALLVQKRKN